MQVRCHSCRVLAVSPICAKCRRIYLTPSPKFRVLPCGLKAVTLFRYENIEPFLLTKHTPRGWLIYRIMARDAFKALSVLDLTGLFVIPVDDKPRWGYSHTAILAKELAKLGCRPLFGRLRAQKRVSYSGKPLSFRIKNPRDFIYRGDGNIDAVLVDDIVTTGLTLQEARQTLQKYGVRVKMAIALADVERER